jgi:hypothetical protein
MSHYEVDLQNNFPEEDIYDWFVEKEQEHKINQDPLVFLEHLIEVGEHYSCFIRGENTDKSPNIFLKKITKLQGRYRQHFILLLGGRYLPKELFIKLCYWVENLLFIYTITRSTRKDINMIRTFSQWSNKLKYIKNINEFDDFVNTYFFKEIKALSREFDLAFRDLTELKIAKFRLRYILAKITHFVNEYAYSTPKYLDEYLDKSITIEHILPKSAKSEIKSIFDKPTEYDFYVGKLGNLLLLEKTINSSISNSNFEFKKNGYKQSQFLLVRSLAEKNKCGNNTKINHTIESLNLIQFDKWNSSDIAKRQEILANIARKVWGLSEIDEYKSIK